jgi:hypothetical protein
MVHRALLHREAIALIAFAYHEISAVTGLLQAWFKTRGQVFQPPTVAFPTERPDDNPWRRIMRRRG